MKRSKHSLTHYKLFSCKMGQLIPISWYEVLPGDTVQQATSALVRAAPMVTPAMHPCHVRIHSFFVPNRIVWQGSQAGMEGGDSFEDFITGGFDGNNATTHPTVSLGTVSHSVGTLADYLGVPVTVVAAAQNVNALPFRAYASIWNEYFRDQDLQTALTIAQTAGSDTTTSTTLQNCAWEKDYLTSARPWELKGPSVSVPVGGNAPIVGLAVQGGQAASAQNTVWETGAGSSTNYTAGWAGSVAVVKGQTTGNASSSNTPQVFANLAGATGVTINTLRHALAIQRFEEARARYGSRYTEYLRYLGVKSSDARLQRPEYLGGGRSTLQISEVLQTGVTTSGTGGGAGGIGQYGGHGIAAARSNRFRRFFEEHGIVMTVMSVRPRTMYSSRMERAWYRGVALSTMAGNKEDYWQRELEHIGQQKINNFEADVSNSETDGIFGYQDRYDEYRRKESSVSGLFRSTLDTWHLSREFGSAPALNSTFVSCTPSTRIFADTSNDNLYIMAHMSVQARRLVAKEGTSLTF